jgi:hypothetical protein
MDFNQAVEISKEDLEIMLSKLETRDDKMNYLFFFRDEVNKQIKKLKK